MPKSSNISSKTCDFGVFSVHFSVFSMQLVIFWFITLAVLLVALFVKNHKQAVMLQIRANLCKFHSLSNYCYFN